jgi:hypothetical protein
MRGSFRPVIASLIVGFGTLSVVVFLPMPVRAAPLKVVSKTPLGALLATFQDPAMNGGDQFGSSVAVSASTAVVADGNRRSAGVAYIFSKGTSGWPTTPTATLPDPLALPVNRFGSSVAVSGTTVVVGASGQKGKEGAVYIYMKGAFGWPTTPTTILRDPNATEDDYFGSSVSVAGNTAIVGAGGTSSGDGAAYIYTKRDLPGHRRRPERQEGADPSWG